MANKPIVGSDKWTSLKDALHQLHLSFREAYWSAKSEAEGDAITALGDATYEIITAMNQAEVESSNDTLKEVKKAIDVVNARLDKAKEEIDAIIHSITLATKIINGIDNVLSKAKGLALG